MTKYVQQNIFIMERSKSVRIFSHSLNSLHNAALVKVLELLSYFSHMSIFVQINGPILMKIGILLLSTASIYWYSKENYSIKHIVTIQSQSFKSQSNFRNFAGKMQITTAKYYLLVKIFCTNFYQSAVNMCTKYYIHSFKGMVATF